MNIDIDFIESNNKHLKILNDSFVGVCKKVVNFSCKTTPKCSVLNIGGGYKKEIEQWLENSDQVDYYCLDIDTSRIENNTIQADITDPELNINKTFDVIISKDTFEHILAPWEAAKNIKKLLKQHGIGIVIAPFSWRYHACPIDTFRYTHTGMRYLFENNGGIEEIFSGYKVFPSTTSWYKSGSDKTISGKPFTESIEVIYVFKKNPSIKFKTNRLDIDNDKH